MDKPKRTCFLITPLGAAGSRIRVRADAIASELLQPVLETRELALLRGDSMPEAGRVLVQVIRELLDAVVVVADLTGANPNVLYELGVADAFRKPVLRLVDDGARLPFNVQGDRVIVVRSDGDGRILSEDVGRARPFIQQFLADVLSWDYKVVNSVSLALEQLPRGIGEIGFARMVGGYQLASGWEGVEKALESAGVRPECVEQKRPKREWGQYRVNLMGVLTGNVAELHLSFGDWMEDEVESYVRELVSALVECGSPFRVVAEDSSRRYVAEPGDLNLTVHRHVR